MLCIKKEEMETKETDGAAFSTFSRVSAMSALLTSFLASLHAIL